MTRPLTTLPPKAQPPKLFYGYVVVAASFVIQIFGWGIYNVYGVFFNPLLAEFGWSRAIISGAVSLSQILVGVGAIILGNLNDRIGPRLLMTFCGIVAGLGYFLMSQVNSVWQLYLFSGAIVGLGVSGTDVVLLSTTARWFIKRRGMMSGIVKIGSGVGIIIASMVVAWLISGHGWRDTYAITGIAFIVCVVACAQLLRRDPSEIGLLPDGEASGPGACVPPAETGLSLREAARTRRFWMFCLAWPSVVFCTFPVMVHIAPHVVDLGFPESFGATMIAVIGVASIAGRLGMGIAGDRLGIKRTLLLNFIVLIAIFSWLQQAKTSWMLVSFALVYGFCHGGLYALYSPLAAEFFGTRAHGSILGIVILSGSVGGVIGPLLTGYIFDTTGGYHIAWVLLQALAVIAFTLILASGSAPPPEAGRGE